MKFFSNLEPYINCGMKYMLFQNRQYESIADSTYQLKQKCFAISKELQLIKKSIYNKKTKVKEGYARINKMRSYIMALKGDTFQSILIFLLHILKY